MKTEDLFKKELLRIARIESEAKFGPERTKAIRVIVEWHVKDEPRRISMDFIRMRGE